MVTILKVSVSFILAYSGNMSMVIKEGYVVSNQGVTPFVKEIRIESGKGMAGVSVGSGN